MFFFQTFTSTGVPFQLKSVDVGSDALPAQRTLDAERDIESDEIDFQVSMEIKPFTLR